MNLFTDLPGAASALALVVAAWVAYRTQVRRAKMSVRILAAPHAWTTAAARRGATTQAPSLFYGDVVLMTGTFAGLVTNDGPRGGAVWSLTPRLSGDTGPWYLDRVSNVQDPYPLPQSACEGITMTFTIGCAYADLEQGIGALTSDGGFPFRLEYRRLAWWGRVRQRRKTRPLSVPCETLLSSLLDGNVDVGECAVIGWVKPRCDELFRPFNFRPNSSEPSILVDWALRRDAFELVVEQVNPATCTLRAKRVDDGQVERGTGVTADGATTTLEQIRDLHRRLVADVAVRRLEIEKTITAARATVTGRSIEGDGRRFFSGILSRSR